MVVIVSGSRMRGNHHPVSGESLPSGGSPNAGSLAGLNVRCDAGQSAENAVLRIAALPAGRSPLRVIQCE